MYLKVLKEINNKLYSIGHLPKWLMREYSTEFPTIIEDSSFPLYCYIYNNDLDILVYSYQGFQLWDVDIIHHVGSYIEFDWYNLHLAKNYNDLYKLCKKKPISLKDSYGNRIVLCDQVILKSRLY